MWRTFLTNLTLQQSASRDLLWLLALDALGCRPLEFCCDAAWWYDPGRVFLLRVIVLLCSYSNNISSVDQQNSNTPQAPLFLALNPLQSSWKKLQITDNGFSECNLLQLHRHDPYRQCGVIRLSHHFRCNSRRRSFALLHVNYDQHSSFSSSSQPAERPAVDIPLNGSFRFH